MRRTNNSLEGRKSILKAHLRYLHSVAANPATLNKEIARRKAEIAKHKAEIARLEETQNTVHDQIEKAEADLREITLKISTAEIQKTIQKYLELKKKVERHANLKP